MKGGGGVTETLSDSKLKQNKEYIWNKNYYIQIGLVEVLWFTNEMMYSNL